MTDQHQPCQRAPGLPITIRESRRTRTRTEAEAPYYDGIKTMVATAPQEKMGTTPSAYRFQVWAQYVHIALSLAASESGEA